MADKKTVLHSSFACDPYMGSEPYVGWNWAKIVADDFDVHVLTRAHHRKSISSVRLPGVAFHFFDLPGFKNLDHRSRWMKPYYLVWQFFVFFKAVFLHLRYKFDIIHHLTYNNLDVPGFLWLLPKAKFVWGPVGGGQVPELFYKRVFGNKGWQRQVLRGRLKQLARYNPIVRLALYKASAVMFANTDTANRFSDIPIKRKVMTLETAINVDSQPKQHHAVNDSDFSILWVGQIEPRKALILAIDAMHALRANYSGVRKIRLNVVGDGPDLVSMKNYVTHLGLDSMVQLHGRMPFNRVGEFFRSADVFLFTSVQDTSGNVVLEAMSHSLPTVALNHHGVKEILCHGGGVLIEPTEYEKTCAIIAKELLRLSKNEELRAELGRAAYQSVTQHFSWSAKREIIKDIYNEILR